MLVHVLFPPTYPHSLQHRQSLGRADVTLRVRMCVAKRASRYARHKGEKGDNFPDVRSSECRQEPLPRGSHTVSGHGTIFTGTSYHYIKRGAI